jgi:hypothetical protein
MWTQENRQRYDRSYLRYESDLSDEEWSQIGSLIPRAKPGGNKRSVDIREVVNGLMYVLGTGCQVRTSIMKAFLAEGIALTGNIDDALQLIDEQIVQIERPGWEERLYYAEILRLKGWILSLKGDLEGAERNFLASLDWARRQQAKMWELRTSTSLARLWQSQGKRQAAHDLLAPVYDWFTEGFDTKDLQEAKALLYEIAMN